VRRLSHGFKATIRAGWVVVKILGSLAVGGGVALGGVSVVTSGASILTTSDRVLLVMGTAAPSAEARTPRELPDSDGDPFAPRRPKKAQTPEESLYFIKMEALITFTLGWVVVFFSLPFSAMRGLRPPKR
jgi:hypothetical protein